MSTDSSAARITSAAAVEIVCETAALGNDDGKADAATYSAGGGDEDAGGEAEALAGDDASGGDTTRALAVEPRKRAAAEASVAFFDCCARLVEVAGLPPTFMPRG